MLPGLRDREVELWAQHDAAAEALAEAMESLFSLQREIVGAYGKPRRWLHKGFLQAVRAEQQRARTRAHLAQDKDYKAEKKRRAKWLRAKATELEGERRNAVNAGRATDQGRDRIAAMRASADRLEGKERGPSEGEPLITAQMLGLGRPAG